MLTTIVDGELDLADVLLVIAALIFLAATIVALVGRSIAGALIPAGLFCTALALFVL